jgi:hypothetical protein
MARPGRNFFLEGWLVGDAAAQALGGQNGEFGLRVGIVLALQRRLEPLLDQQTDRRTAAEAAAAPA